VEVVGVGVVVVVVEGGGDVDTEGCSLEPHLPPLEPHLPKLYFILSDVFVIIVIVVTTTTLNSIRLYLI